MQLACVCQGDLCTHDCRWVPNRPHAPGTQEPWSSYPSVLLLTLTMGNSLMPSRHRFLSPEVGYYFFSPSSSWHA